MKRHGLLAVALLASIASSSQTLKPQANTVQSKTTESAPAAISANVYYPTPMGVTYRGVDKTEKFDGDFAYAPTGVWLETMAEAKGSFEWKFSDGFDKDGKEIFATSTTTEFQFRNRKAETTSAPLLSLKSGAADYTMAKDGIKYGEMGDDEHFSVNYQPGQTTRFDVAPDVLNVNDRAASQYLNLIMAMTGGFFSDIEILGFSESFYDCGAFYLEKISAEVYCDSKPECSDFQVKVFHREQTKVSEEEIAQLTCVDVYEVGNNRYYITFECDEPTYIQSAMQVVVMPTNDKVKFSPVVPLQSYYKASNAGTCAFYANFKLLGKPVEKSYLDFFGTESSDDDGKVIGYINHWAIGVKGSYTEPSNSIFDSVCTTPEKDQTVYNILGVKVGKLSDANSLPAGIYICAGKKFIVR